MYKKTLRFGLLFYSTVLTSLLISPPGCKGQQAAPKSIEQMNKEFLIAYTEDFWNTQNLSAFEKYYSPDFIMHSATGDRNFEQYKALCQGYFTAFPDLHITTEDMIAEGDQVAKRWIMTCTHKGEFMGIPGTGKPISVKGIEIFRIKDGRIVELWVSMDNLGMLKQLGVIKPGTE